MKQVHLRDAINRYHLAFPIFKPLALLEIAAHEEVSIVHFYIIAFMHKTALFCTLRMRVHKYDKFERYCDNFINNVWRTHNLAERDIRHSGNGIHSFHCDTCVT